MKPIEITLLAIVGITFLLGMRKNAAKQISSMVCTLISLIVTYFGFIRLFGRELPVVVNINSALFIFALEALFFMVLYFILCFFAPVFFKNLRNVGGVKGAAPMKLSFGQKMKNGSIYSAKWLFALIIFIVLCGFMSETHLLPKSLKTSMKNSKVVSAIEQWGKQIHWSPMTKLRRFVLVVEDPSKTELLFPEAKLTRLRSNRVFMTYLNNSPAPFGIFSFFDSRVQPLYSDYGVYEIFFQ